MTVLGLREETTGLLVKVLDLPGGQNRLQLSWGHWSYSSWHTAWMLHHLYSSLGLSISCDLIPHLPQTKGSCSAMADYNLVQLQESNSTRGMPSSTFAAYTSGIPYVSGNCCYFERKLCNMPSVSSNVQQVCGTAGLTSGPAATLLENAHH